VAAHARNVTAGLFQSSILGKLFGGEEVAPPKVDVRDPAPAAPLEGAAPAPPTTPPATVPLQGIPPRPADALSGTEVAARLKTLPLEKREQFIQEQVAKGNIPESQRTLERVTVKRQGADGKEHEITTYVMPDYVSLGSDKDSVRVPMTPMTAQKIGDQMNCSLPTRQMVNDIYGSAQRKPVFEGLQGTDAYRASGQAYVDHDAKMDKAMSGMGEGGIAAGHKKDIIIPAPEGKVGIYGGFDAKGQPIHNFKSHAHGDFYVDYSHGARMVSNTVYVDGKPMPMDQVLRDPDLAPLLSDTGAMDRTRYPTRSKNLPNV